MGDVPLFSRLPRSPARYRVRMTATCVFCAVAAGEAAGQEIFHIHLHVIPRFRGDGFTLRIDYDRAPSRTRLDEHAGIISASLRGAEA